MKRGASAAHLDAISSVRWSSMATRARWRSIEFASFGLNGPRSQTDKKSVKPAGQPASAGFSPPKAPAPRIHPMILWNSLFCEGMGPPRPPSAAAATTDRPNPRTSAASRRNYARYLPTQPNPINHSLGSAKMAAPLEPFDPFRDEPVAFHSQVCGYACTFCLSPVVPATVDRSKAKAKGKAGPCMGRKPSRRVDRQRDTQNRPPARH